MFEVESKVPPETITDIETKMREEFKFCRKCGEELVTEARFCKKCGQRIEGGK